MDKVIFMFTGLGDIEAAGNQSLKNGIKYLARLGYRVWVFTFMPSNYPNLLDPKLEFGSNVKFYRLPGMLSFVLNTGKKVKDVLGRRSNGMSRRGEVGGMQGHAMREYNSLGRIFYLVFLFALYIPVELARGLAFSLKCRPDVIYGVNWQGWAVGNLMGRMLGKPVITRFFGVSVTEYDLASLKSRLLMLDEIAGLKSGSDAVIVTDDGTRGDRILRLLDVPEERVRFWMNGMDMDHLALPEDWNPEGFRKTLGIDGKIVVLMVSRLSVWKRVDRGIRAVHKVVKQHGVSDVVLLIAGDGPERHGLENLASELGVEEEVRFLGGVHHGEVAKYYSAADIFMSLYDVSNLGNPLLEALYFGLPIVSLDDGSASSLLRDQYNCLLARPDNAEEELPLLLKMLVKYGPMREAIGRHARETFDDKVLSWQERVKLEDDLIRGIICNREAR